MKREDEYRAPFFFLTKKIELESVKEEDRVL